MEQHIPLSGPIDLDALDDYLLSDHAPGDRTGVRPILTAFSPGSSLGRS